MSHDDDPERRLGLLLFLLSLLLAGCYSSEQVKPSEIPKLNASFAEPVAHTGNATVMAVSVARVEKPDGTLTEVRGTHDVELTLRSGEELTFKSPVLAETEEDGLVLRSEDRSKTKVLFKDIEKAEVSQYDGTKTMLAWMGGGMAAMGVLILVGVASTSL